MNDMLAYEAQKKSGVLAAFLNWLIPGVGYFYAGSALGGVLAIIFGIGFWLVALVSFGIATPLLGLFYLIVIIDGFLAAGRHNRRLAMRIQSGA
ncbi:MAG: hypothetical protein ACQEXJ_19615 [Myxococcota bacterium]